MEYKHISSCWEAIRQAKTISEVEKLFEEFPRWSGDWYVQIEKNSFYEDTYVVYNHYFDENTETDDTDCETLDIEVEQEGEE